jgi:multiple antibiotic resistance protein
VKSSYSFLTIVVPLLIIMDPFGNLPLFLLFTKSHTPSQRRKMAAVATATAGGILIFFSVTGDFVLRLFGIGLPAFQLAGGFIFFVYALQMLRLIPSGIKMTDEEEHEGTEKASPALVPLATPLLAGPGAITAVLVWRQSSEDPMAMLIVVAAIGAACLVIFLSFCCSTVITRILGLGGIRVVTRLTGLLLAVIAVQFMVEGFRQLQ